MKTADRRLFGRRVVRGIFVALVLLTAHFEPAHSRAAARKKAKDEKARVLVTPDFLMSRSGGAVFQIQSMTYHVSFSDLTDPSKLVLSILCRMSPDSMPQEYLRDAVIRSVVFAGDRSPAPEDFLALKPTHYMMRVAQNTNQFTFQMTLPIPRAKSDGIDRIEGVLRVFYRTPSMDSAFLPVVRGESVPKDAGMARLALSEVNARDGVIRVQIVGEAKEALRRLPDREYQWTLVMQNGKTYRWDDMDVTRPARTSDSAARDFSMWCAFRAPGAANKVKGVIVSWMNDSPETQIPFVFEDIPLP